MESNVVIEYLSTHPTDSNRASEMEESLSAVLELRQTCNCPELTSDFNPIEEAYQLRSAVANLRLLSKSNDSVDHVGFLQKTKRIENRDYLLEKFR